MPVRAVLNLRLKWEYTFGPRIRLSDIEGLGGLGFRDHTLQCEKDVEEFVSWPEEQDCSKLYFCRLLRSPPSEESSCIKGLQKSPCWKTINFNAQVAKPTHNAHRLYPFRAWASSAVGAVPDRPGRAVTAALSFTVKEWKPVLYLKTPGSDNARNDWETQSLRAQEGALILTQPGVQKLTTLETHFLNP